MENGWTDSLYKSLAVKSLRIGWPEGLRIAEERLGKSSVSGLLLCGIWEDVFPAESEVAEVNRAARRCDYEALCSYETHHGRGLTDAFCDLEVAAVAAAKNREPLWKEGRELGVWLPNRALNCFYTWLMIRPTDAGVRRELDSHRYSRMPAAVADSHTKEGKALGVKMTVVSGHYEQHRKLGKLVQSGGWEPVRRRVHRKSLVVS